MEFLQKSVFPTQIGRNDEGRFMWEECEEYRMDSGFEREVLDRLMRMEAKLESYDHLKEQVYQNQRNMMTQTQKITQQQSELLELKDRNKWLARAIAGASISAVIGLMVLYLRLGAGI